MIIKQVKLNNIRSYSDATIEFPTGSVMLSGDIGSGKSTILLSIEFCLFGLTSEVDGNALLRNGKAQAEAELKMAIEGREIIVKRTLKKIKDSVRQDYGYIIMDGQKHEGTAVELKARVLELLGYPKELLTKSKSLIYRYTVYTPQEEMKLILLENNMNRLDTLRKVFQIDKYKRVKDNTVIALRAIREKAKLLGAKTDDLPDCERRKNELEGELRVIESCIAELLPRIELLENEITTKKAANEGIEEKSRALSELRKNLEVANARIKERDRLIKEGEAEISRAESEIKEIEQKISAAEGMNEKFSMLVFSARKESERLTEQISSKARLKDELGTVESELSKINAEIRKNQYITETSRKLVSGVTSLETCPTCRQPVSQDHKQHIESVENEKISAADKATEQQGIVRKAHEDTMHRIKKEIENIQSKESMLAALKAELSACEETIGELGFEIRPYEAIHITTIELAEMRRLNRILREGSSMKERANDRKKAMAGQSQRTTLLAQEKAELMKEAAYLTEQAIELRGVEDEIKAARKELEEIFRKEKELLMQKSSLNSSMLSVNKQITSLALDIEKKNSLRAEAEKLKKLTYWLDEHFTGMVDAIERQVMLRVHNEFNSFLQAWFSVLMEDENMSIRLNEEFTPIIEQNGYELLFDNLSGGERTSCALAYRLALNKVINDFSTGIRTKDLIILDEPTDGFSSEQLERVRDVLAQLNIAQTIIVSHESKIESFVDHVIRIEKDDGMSRVIA